MYLFLFSSFLGSHGLYLFLFSRFLVNSLAFTSSLLLCDFRVLDWLELGVETREGLPDGSDLLFLHRVCQLGPGAFGHP